MAGLKGFCKCHLFGSECVNVLTVKIFNGIMLVLSSLPSYILILDLFKIDLRYRKVCAL